MRCPFTSDGLDDAVVDGQTEPGLMACLTDLVIDACAVSVLAGFGPHGGRTLRSPAMCAGTPPRRLLPRTAWSPKISRILSFEVDHDAVRLEVGLLDPSRANRPERVWRPCPARPTQRSPGYCATSRMSWEPSNLPPGVRAMFAPCCSQRSWGMGVRAMPWNLVGRVGCRTIFEGDRRKVFERCTSA